MNEIVTYGGHQLISAADLRAQVNAVQAAMQAVMKDGVHFGTIPGTPKPSLWKPGAEVLFTMFRLAPRYEIEDLSNADCVRYRIRCIATHQPTGITMGEGIGEASSNEEKYRWRKASSHKEFENTPENRRRTKYGFSRDSGEYEIRQVRTEIADIANTILKMAAKRAHVACALNVTAASDCFSQDIEDLPPELQAAVGDEPKRTVEKPKPKPRANKPDGGKQPAHHEVPPENEAEANHTPASPAMLAHIKKLLERNALSTSDVHKRFPEVAETLEGVTVAQTNAILKWVANPTE